MIIRVIIDDETVDPVREIANYTFCWGDEQQRKTFETQTFNAMYAGQTVIMYQAEPKE
jgi:hypothetical protein